MGSLLCFLAIACVLSFLSLVSRSSSLWPRMPLAFLLAAVYGCSASGLLAHVPISLLLIGLAFSIALWRQGCLSASAFRVATGPLVVAVLVSLYVAFRPSLLEYPVDHINYWQRLMEAAGLGSANASICRMEGPAAYAAECTLWIKLAAAWPVSGSWYVSGTFARLVHLGEVLLLAISLLRLWLIQQIKPLAAASMLVLVIAGTGYLYDAFVINHALQGSILAAALFAECASALCWLQARLRCAATRRSGYRLVLAWYALLSVYLLLETKLHGLFSLLILVCMLVLPVIMPLIASFPRTVRWFGSRSALLFASIALALTTSLFVVRGAISIPIAPNFAGVVIRWGDHLGFRALSDWGPVSFVPRTSDTRPEALAVLGLIAAVVVIWLCFREPSLIRGPWSDYAILSSAFAVSILVAYMVPPFSNLFLKLNPHYSSHMRLMWGVCLVSPLPCLLFASGRRFSRVSLLGSVTVLAVILLPVQFSSGQRKQLFFSKALHLVVPTPPWADPSRAASILMPEIERISGAKSSSRGIYFVADPIIRSSLYPFALRSDPALVPGGDRLSQVADLPPAAIGSSPASNHLRSLRFPLGLPDFVIQQEQRDCSFSVYAEMRAYDACIAARATGFDVNRWGAGELRRLGYVLKWTSTDGDYLVWWRRSP